MKHYYVTATARGKTPDGQKHKMVAVCDDYSRADEIHALWSSFGDRTHVYIRTSFPYYSGCYVTRYDSRLTKV
jgi:hypothetical protein